VLRPLEIIPKTPAPGQILKAKRKNLETIPFFTHGLSTIVVELITTFPEPT
jgi:hypothetical protein